MARNLLHVLADGPSADPGVVSPAKMLPVLAALSRPPANESGVDEDDYDDDGFGDDDYDDYDDGEEDDYDDYDDEEEDDWDDDEELFQDDAKPLKFEWDRDPDVLGEEMEG